MIQKYGVCYYTHFGILYDFLYWIEVEKITFIVQLLPLCRVLQKWQCIFKNATFTTYILSIPAHKIPKECLFKALSCGISHITIS